MIRVAAIYDSWQPCRTRRPCSEDIRRRGATMSWSAACVTVPMPRETLACLRNLDIPVQFIQGNGDREVLALMRGIETGTVPESYRAVMRWNAQQLHPEDEQILGAWPKTIRVEIDGLGEVLFCHATPRNDTEIFTRLTSEDRLRPIFEGLNARLVICGHTHMQFDRAIGSVRVCTRQRGNAVWGTRAYWAYLDPSSRGIARRSRACRRRIRRRSTAARTLDARKFLRPHTEQRCSRRFLVGELK